MGSLLNNKIVGLFQYTPANLFFLVTPEILNLYEKKTEKFIIFSL